MIIAKVSPTSPDIAELLADHQEKAVKQECGHAFGVERLSQDDIHFYAARDDQGALMGVAAFKLLSADHGEIKSVRTHDDFLRRGVSRALMAEITQAAQSLGMSRLSLETHSTPAYAAARGLYENLGYDYCDAFGDYGDDPLSVYMTRQI